jgi:wyosine [tRNA(Phe)-imidazoG37] synthetase (radical SAM superfamily)
MLSYVQARIERLILAFYGRMEEIQKRIVQLNREIGIQFVTRTFSDSGEPVLLAKLRELDALSKQLTALKEKEAASTQNPS